MRTPTSQIVRVLGLGMLTFAIVACGAKKKEPTTVEKVVSSVDKGPDYQEFAPLPLPAREVAMPFLLGPDGIYDEPCFVIQEGLVPEQNSIEARALIDDHKKTVEATLRNWLTEVVAPSTLSEATVAGWKIKVEAPVALTALEESIRFVEEQSCIDSNRGWMPEDVHAVTKLFGAQAFEFTATVPVDYATVEEFRSELEDYGLKFESADLVVYEPATDDKGEPRTNKEGETLYLSAAGVLIPEKELPPAEEQTVSKFSITSDKVVYFGFRELSDASWRKEAKKDLCDVFLVWGDPTARAPECEEYTESSFAAKETEDGEVAIAIETDGKRIGDIFEYDRGTMVQVSDRIILWISPKKIEEGVRLRLNSVVLDPKDRAKKAAESTSYVPTRSATDDEAPAQKSGKKAKKKKKGSKSDQDILDSYFKE